MKQKNFKIFVVLVAIVFLSLSCKRENPRVLIVGDSISIGYFPFVESYFSGKATVVHNKGNAQHTGNGLSKIHEWVGDQKWDVIQINWGLWDLCYRNPDAKNQGNRD